MAEYLKYTPELANDWKNAFNHTKKSMPYIMASLQSFLEQDYKNKELIIGYYKRSSHNIVSINECPVLSKSIIDLFS